MKILIVTGIFPPDHGGPAYYVPAMAQGLKRRGWEIVAVLTLSDRLDHDDWHYGFPIVRLLRRRFLPLRWLLTLWTMVRLVRQADVVYLNGLVFEGILVTKFMVRRPVVVKVVGDLIWEKARNSRATTLELDTFQSAQLPFYWRCLRRLQSWYTEQADNIIAPSRYLAGIVSGWGIRAEKIRVVYNAVTVPPAGAQTLDYDLVTMARLVPWKGLAELIEVAAEQKLRLLIAGDGSLRDELEALAARLDAQVTFAGRVAHDQVFDTIRRGRLFVLNSSYEGLPHIVLEAKASGVAVLASSAGGTPETIHHGIDGWLVPVNDKMSLSSAIQQLLGDDRLRESLAQAGYRQIAEQFSVTAQLDATAAILSGSGR